MLRSSMLLPLEGKDLAYEVGYSEPGSGAQTDLATRRLSDGEG